jgi:cytochrome d ubiquinol oxidase subunit I
VPGIDDILNGYTMPDGTKEPSVDEKIERGKQAIAALAAYRKLKEEVRVNSEKFATAEKKAEAVSMLNSQLSILNSNMPYFGYGYVKDKNDVVPPIWLNFWAFRIMVGLGCVFILYFLLMVILSFKIPYLSVITRRLLATIGLLPETKADCHDIAGLPAWHYWLAILLVPLAYIASESGWMVAELGRQPWTIQDMLPTWVGVSDIESCSVALTFFLFLFLFTLMLCVEINILLKQIKKGPNTLDN